MYGRLDLFGIAFIPLPVIHMLNHALIRERIRLNHALIRERIRLSRERICLNHALIRLNHALIRLTRELIRLTRELIRLNHGLIDLSLLVLLHHVSVAKHRKNRSDLVWLNGVI